MNFALYKENVRTYVGKKIRQHPTLFYLRTVWKYRNDCDFVNHVMRIYNDPNLFRMKSFGGKNPSRNIFLIELGGTMGLGGYLRRTFSGLAEADRLGFTPVVSYQVHSCLYAEKNSVNGVKNPFEYYFMPVSDITLDEVYESKRVFLFESAHELRVEHDLGNINAMRAGGYDVTQEYLEQLAVLMKKYLRLNPQITTVIERGFQEICPEGWSKKRILGIHIRGTDYALNWQGHPNMVGVEDFISATETLLERENYDFIFLATDDLACLDAMRKRYRERLRYYVDVHRGTGDFNVSQQHNERIHNNYLNGMEVVRDMYTLAYCDSLICGLSQVSLLSRVIKLSMGQKYKVLEVLDKGVYGK